ncbi:MAG: hypothetical protein KGL91_00405 [Xanthomonadaceae bacterium]|nr:hypothetical protein [Xanthomonadaceae bacterium]
MRTVKHSPTALPWQRHPGKSLRRHAGSHLLDSAEVAQFDRLVHQIHPQAHHVDADRIATLARWLLDLPEAQAGTLLNERLARIELLRATLVDPDWAPGHDSREPIGKLLAYIDQRDGQGMIPASIPLLGLLDDALLLELAWPALQVEAEDYRDFCDYRDVAQPQGDGAQRRDAWIRERLEALALYRHHAQVNASHYADSGQPRQSFRIS